MVSSKPHRITLMESYLSDTFINTVLGNDTYIRRFVETFHDYSSEMVKLNDIYSKFDELDIKVTKSMMDIIYHNIPKVQGMYKDTLGVDFPKDIKIIHKAISYRHDIVHRNGKDKKGTMCNFNIENVIEILTEVERLIERIQEQINMLNVKNDITI